MEPKDWLQNFKRQERLSDFSERPEALLIVVGQRENHHLNPYHTRSLGRSWLEVWTGMLARRAKVRIARRLRRYYHARQAIRPRQNQKQKESQFTSSSTVLKCQRTLSAEHNILYFCQAICPRLRFPEIYLHQGRSVSSCILLYTYCRGLEPGPIYINFLPLERKERQAVGLLNTTFSSVTSFLTSFDS